MFFVAVTFGSLLVFNIFANWLAAPIITTIDDTDYAVNKIDFPAVTICPSEKVMPNKLANQVCKKK